MNNQISVETLQPVLHDGVKVITTELLAQLYGTEALNIQVNHTRNKNRFVEGKHFFKIEGAELKEFKNRLTESKSVGDRLSLSQSVGKRARSLILWTERGAARHAKMLETDQAWEVFERLEDFYFTKGEAVHERRQEGVPATQTEINAYYAASTARQLNMIRQVWDDELKHLLISIQSPIYNLLSSRIPDACILAEKSSSRLLAQLPDGAVPKLY